MARGNTRASSERTPSERLIGEVLGKTLRMNELARTFEGLSPESPTRAKVAAEYLKLKAEAEKARSGITDKEFRKLANFELRTVNKPVDNTGARVDLEKASRAEREVTPIEQANSGIDVEAFLNTPISTTREGNTIIGSRAGFMENVDTTRRSGRSYVKQLLDRDFKRDPLLKNMAPGISSSEPEPGELGEIDVNIKGSLQNADQIVARVKEIADSYRVKRGAKQDGFYLTVVVRDADGRQIAGRSV